MVVVMSEGIRSKFRLKKILCKDALLLKVDGNNSFKGHIILRVSTKRGLTDKSEGLRITKEGGRWRPQLGGNFTPKLALCRS